MALAHTSQVAIVVYLSLPHTSQAKQRVLDRPLPSATFIVCGPYVMRLSASFGRPPVYETGAAFCL